MNRMTRSFVSLALALTLALVSLVGVGRAVAGLFSGAATPPATTPDAGQADDAEQGASEQGASEETAADQEAAAAREAFVSTWAARIDAFDAGYPLEGYGRTFAEAAYDNGIDPRFAPAIARVESGSGANCTYSCNAWGWGSSSWPDWDTAIWEYTGALASAYGRTLSYEAALSYNEETPDAWYAEVEASMYQIWESEDL